MENTKLIRGIRYDMQNRPLNGIVNVYYKTGELLLEMPYINGKAKWYCKRLSSKRFFISRNSF